MGKAHRTNSRHRYRWTATVKDQVVVGGSSGAAVVDGSSEAAVGCPARTTNK